MWCTLLAIGNWEMAKTDWILRLSFLKYANALDVPCTLCQSTTLDTKKTARVLPPRPTENFWLVRQHVLVHHCSSFGQRGSGLRCWWWYAGLGIRIRIKDNQSLLTGTFCCEFFLRLTPFAARFLPLVAGFLPFAMGGEVDGLVDMVCLEALLESI